MEYRLLGPLEVRADDGSLLSLGGTKQRALLALLLINANRAVARERLIDELWGDDPPARAVASIQVYVSRLRKQLPEGTLLTRSPGYLLKVDPHSVDFLRFERLVAEARTLGPERSAEVLQQALELWRGSALTEFDEEPFARAEADRLEDMRLAALEERVAADLALGRHVELVGELERLITINPYRGRLRGQLMLALYRSDREADALAAYRNARAALDELGIEPSERLRALERQILAHDPALDLQPQGLLTAERARLPGPLVPESPFQFVGRLREATELRSALNRAQGGEGGVVLLTGEPGAGKTRLIREFANTAVDLGALVLYGVSDASVRTPYQPLREWLEFLIQVCDRDALVTSLGAEGSRLTRVAPELATLGIPAAEAGVADEDRYLLQSAATNLLRRLSRAHPLLLAIDDLHWADTETLELLGRLARIAPEARILVVAAYRDPGEEMTSQLADALAVLGRLDAVRRLTLGGLTGDEISELVRTSIDVEASTELASAIVELTNGTPLLVCELWRDLQESNAVEFADNGVRLSRPVAELRGSERIHEVVRHRLSRLSPMTSRMVEVAAVAGPRFELQVVAAAASLDQSALIDAVRQASRHGIIEELPEPTPTGRFTHELIRRAVYDPIQRVRLPELHLRVGEALERVHAADPERVLPELAYHFTLAAQVAGTQRAATYNVRAAERAALAAAFGEAAARYSTALELGIGDQRERTRVQIELGTALFQSGRLVDAIAVLEKARDAATQLGEAGLAAHATIQILELRLTWDSAVGSAEIVPFAEEAIGMFGRLGDSRGLALAERVLASALNRLGRSEESLAAFERALAHVDAADDAHARRSIILSLSTAYWIGPMPVPEAIRKLEHLRTLSRDDRLSEAIVNGFLSNMVAMAGRFDEAGELFEASTRVLDAAEDWKDPWTVRRHAAESKRLAGDDVGAEQELLAVWAHLRGNGHTESNSQALRTSADLAHLYADQGRWDAAAECLSFGQESSDLRYGKVYPPTYGKYYSFVRHAAQARVAAHLGDIPTALELAQRAVEVGERTSSLNLRARVWLAVAEVERAAGRRSETEAADAKALELYERKGNLAALARLRRGT